jgi:soluble lytic murein transglycosylase-like protein
VSTSSGAVALGLLLVLLLCAPLRAGRAAERAFDSPTCLAVIGVVERESGIPSKLLKAIALAETARADPATGQVAPWAWSINANGAGEMFGSKIEAIAAARAKLTMGVASVDVGCMQVSLMYHPNAFASMEEAFDPETNVRYAASFLRALYRQTGSWIDAAMAYHSQTPDIGADYLRKVIALWPAGPTFAAAAGRIGLARRSATAIAINTDYTPEFAAWVRQNAADAAHMQALHSSTVTDDRSRETGRRRLGNASAGSRHASRPLARERSVALMVGLSDWNR